MGNIMSGNLIPAMTSATAPSGTVSSSGDDAGGPSWKAFDGNSTSSSIWWSTLFTSIPLPIWIAYDFGFSVTILGYAITGNATASAPKDWEFQGWNGGSWVTLDTQANQSFSAGELKQYGVAPGDYSQIRLYVTGAASGATSISLREIDVMGPDPLYPWLTLPITSDEVAQHTDYNLPVTFHNATDSNIATATKNMTNNRVVGTGTEYTYTIDGASWASLKNLVVKKG